MRSENVPINGPMFKQEAQEFGEQLNLEDFHVSDVGTLLFTFEHIFY